MIFIVPRCAAKVYKMPGVDFYEYEVNKYITINLYTPFVRDPRCMEFYCDILDCVCFCLKNDRSDSEIILPCAVITRRTGNNSTIEQFSMLSILFSGTKQNDL